MIHDARIIKTYQGLEAQYGPIPTLEQMSACLQTTADVLGTTREHVRDVMSQHWAGMR